MSVGCGRLAEGKGRETDIKKRSFNLLCFGSVSLVTAFCVYAAKASLLSYSSFSVLLSTLSFLATERSELYERCVIFILL